MVSKVVKISETNYRWLSQKAGELQMKKGEPISLDETISFLRTKKISNLAGCWEMDNKELKKIKKDIKRGWEWQIKSV